MKQLQTIGELEAKAAAKAAIEADPRTAYGWTCPLEGARSQLSLDESDTQESFKAHLSTHSIQDCVPLLMQSAWLSTFELQNIADNR